MEWSRDLREAPQGEAPGESMYSIPMRVSGGATGRLSPRLHLNASAVYQDWSAAEGFAEGVVSQRKWNFGVGLEWLMADGETRSLPVRFGYRQLAAPFRYEKEDPVESIWSLGVGFNLLKRGGPALRVDGRGPRTGHAHERTPGRALLAGDRHHRRRAILTDGP